MRDPRVNFLERVEVADLFVLLVYKLDLFGMGKAGVNGLVSPLTCFALHCLRVQSLLHLKRSRSLGGDVFESLFEVAHDVEVLAGAIAEGRGMGEDKLSGLAQVDTDLSHVWVCGLI